MDHRGGGGGFHVKWLEEAEGGCRKWRTAGGAVGADQLIQLAAPCTLILIVFASEWVTADICTIWTHKTTPPFHFIDMHPDCALRFVGGC